LAPPSDHESLKESAQIGAVRFLVDSESTSPIPIKVEPVPPRVTCPVCPDMGGCVECGGDPSHRCAYCYLAVMAARAAAASAA
jgi:hypothetical protein